ncbi:MAG TPA: prephenate dehydrogenase [Bacteroidota bacterium]|nr:prephenate dehydrogenase [Bacteroidota bacterium]
MIEEVAIIGYGRFGKLAASHLKKHAKVFVADLKKPHISGHNITAVPIEIAAAKRIVILAVPINRLPALLQRISAYVRKDAIVSDVCSVKEQPLKWMKKYLPKHTSFVGMHPLFGPVSASESLKGRNIILCQGSLSRRRIAVIHSILRKAGLNVFEMTPAEHDRLMASTLFLSQLVGHSLLGYQLPETIITTQNFAFLKQIELTSRNDSKELFNDMFRYNRFARKVPNNLLSSLLNIINTLYKTRT